LITNALDIPTFIDNDVNLCALGEAWKGAAQSYENVVAIMIGTGIGGGILINGDIYRGHNMTAGEIGHMVIDHDGDIVCGCGQRGCFEALASRSAMARDLHMRKAAAGVEDMIWAENNLLSNEIAYHYLAGDADAVAVVNQAGQICGKAIFTILNLFNPDIIVFSGGFVYQLGKRFLDPVLREAEKCMNAVYSLDDKRIPIVIGALPNPVLYGACKMAVERSGGKVEHHKREIIFAIADGLTDRERRILREMYRHGGPVPLSKHPGADYNEDRLRRLRNRGLLQTDGDSFRRSTDVRLTTLGRILVEEAAAEPAALADSRHA
jgi:predicted NBD/HSP70 family sugar kinase